MEIVGLFACLSFIAGAFIWHYTRIEQAKIQYGNPKIIEDLKKELERQAAIVNRLDAEGLEHVSQKANEIAARLNDIKISNLVRR